MKKPYVNQWGAVRQVQLPRNVVTNETLSLSPSALSVLVCLFQTEKLQRLRHDFNTVYTFNGTEAVLKITTKRMMERTGYAKNAITDALKELQESCYIRRETSRKKDGGFAVNEYTLLNPMTAAPLQLPAPGQNLLIRNRLSYFSVPACLVTNFGAPWSLANLDTSSKALLFAILYMANVKRSLEFETNRRNLRQLCSVKTSPTFNRAMSCLRDIRLVRCEELTAERLALVLCDPFTGEPFHLPDGTDENDPSNYYVESKCRKRSGRVDINAGTDADVEAFVRSLFPDSPVIDHGGDDLLFRCCLHDDKTPSLSFSRKLRCFHCLGCGASGGFLKLIQQATRCERAQAIQKLGAALTGTPPVFREPVSRAAARHQYRSKHGDLIKEVLRFPTDGGGKVFQQRRPCPGGFSYDLSGIGPLLYNEDQLRNAGVIVITEGEKDADSVTSLHLIGQGGLVVGVTSGGAGSWHPSLAKLLASHKKPIIVLPDDDEPGAKYAVAVRASLEAEGIHCHLASFSGTGCKDVSEFLERHSVDDLVLRIGSPWLSTPDGRQIVCEEVHPDVLNSAASIEGDGSIFC